MKKLLLLIFFLLQTTLFAQLSIQKLRFESGISLYGRVGFVNLELREDDQTHTYKMVVSASSTGLVKLLTHDRKDIFISEGTIQNGVYLPKKFTKETISATQYKRTVYLFDYTRNKVIRKRLFKKLETQKIFDPILMKTHEKSFFKVSKKDKKEITLYRNDFLSLYLNMQKGNLKKGEVAYVDMSSKNHLFLVANNKIHLQKHNGDESYDIELYYDKGSIFFDKVVSENIAFYGDAYIKKISETSL